jgi:hypothetical protein
MHQAENIDPGNRELKILFVCYLYYAGLFEEFSVKKEKFSNFSASMNFNRVSIV